MLLRLPAVTLVLCWSAPYSRWHIDLWRCSRSLTFHAVERYYD